MNKPARKSQPRPASGVNSNTSWQNVSEWYDKIVGKEGHYYHQHIILPKSLELLSLGQNSVLLDMACGQGVLGRAIPAGIAYTGIDNAAALINQAKRLDQSKKHEYIVGDVTLPLTLKKQYTHTAMVLALQNIALPEKVIQNAQTCLKSGGRFLIVLNHPIFRIPRQSSWGIDEKNKTEYRRIDRYLSPLKVPLSTSPGKGKQSEMVWTYHLPLSEYSRLLNQQGFVIEKIEEWISDKTSSGGAAKMENRARAEFPLFLAILAIKK